MSGDKRDETGRQAVHLYLDAARERELILDAERIEKKLLRSAREMELSHAPRREKEFILRKTRETIRENKRAASGPARFRLIGHVLRRAAGLPDVEDPFIERSDEAHLPNAGGVISMMFLVTYDFSPPNPRAVEAELEAIRRDLERLIYRIGSLESSVIMAIDHAGDPGLEEFNAALLSRDNDRILSETRARQAMPYETTTVAALDAMGQLQGAIAPVIEQAIEAGAQLPTTGRIPNLAARNVAYLVAKYLRNVTGKIPGLTTRPELAGPYARALLEIFEIQDIKADIQRAGEWAISKLTSKLSKKS